MNSLISLVKIDTVRLADAEHRLDLNWNDGHGGLRLRQHFERAIPQREIENRFIEICFGRYGTGAGGFGRWIGLLKGGAFGCRGFSCIHASIDFPVDQIRLRDIEFQQELGCRGTYTRSRSCAHPHRRHTRPSHRHSGTARHRSLTMLLLQAVVASIERFV